MSFPEEGDWFPDFKIGDLDTKEARKYKPLAMIVWRTGCSTCRYTLPFWQRLHEANPEAVIFGICQDDEPTMHDWCRDHGVTFRQFTDKDLQVTHLFEVETVPSYW